MKITYEVYCKSRFCCNNIPPLPVPTIDEAEEICETQDCQMCGGSLFLREIDDDEIEPAQS